MIEKVKKEVFKLLDQEHSGHGIEHINRVLNLSLKFAEQEKANKELTALIALLHDTDDYKLFGSENAEKLIHARNILEKCRVSDTIQEEVLNAIKRIGYNKRLDGMIPNTLEGKIVSDADMCDAIGATGIIRSMQYNYAHNNPFFDKNTYPLFPISAEDYIKKKDGTVVTHMFEKMLKLKNLMITPSGKKEAQKRHQIMIDFLYHFFEEENVPEWTLYLNRYLDENK